MTIELAENRRLNLENAENRRLNLENAENRRLNLENAEIWRQRNLPERIETEENWSETVEEWPQLDSFAAGSSNPQIESSNQSDFTAEFLDFNGSLGILPDLIGKEAQNSQTSTMPYDQLEVEIFDRDRLETESTVVKKIGK